MENFVYFAHRPTVHNLVKVGISTAPHARMAAFGYAASPALVLGYVPGTLGDEQAIHAALSQTRVEGGEWFTPSRRLSRLIDYCTMHGRLPDVIARAGGDWLRLRDAKRAFALATRESINFFGDENRAGFDWSQAA